MSKVRVRLTIGAGTPDLYQDLLGFDDRDRGERLKHLAELGLLYKNREEQTRKQDDISPPALLATPESLQMNPLRSVVQSLQSSLD